MLSSSRISFYRIKKGWTKAQLAEKADISKTYIGELEAGSKQPTVPVAMRIAKALEVDLMELLEKPA